MWELFFDGPPHLIVALLAEKAMTPDPDGKAV
jgi:hypothetical protein